jgi:poly-gamma-glutamate capsule biosynthesis protein CapA/YwtB (metallophosphatase superfamily)
MASIFRECGLDVVSLAGNHAMDFGAETLLDTIDTLRDLGIQVVGAGRNIEEARKPVIIERKGVKVAFLAYCSVLNEGFAAGPNSPGAAPMRAYTYYRTIDYQPGTPPVVVTVPYEDHLKAKVADIAAIRKSVDAVVLSLHWGLHYVPKVIVDYQPIVAKAAFDAGADAYCGPPRPCAQGHRCIRRQTLFL